MSLPCAAERSRGVVAFRACSSVVEHQAASDGRLEVGGSIPSGPMVSGLAARRSSTIRDEDGGEGSIPSRTDRLYAITRADLPVGARAAQVGHALIGFTTLYGSPCENLVVLQVRDKEALEKLSVRLNGRVVCFREPDFGDELTAIAAGPECWRALSSIPLMR